MFKKGQSGNPGGRPKIPEHLRKVPLLTDQALKYTISMYFEMTCAELEKARYDKKTKSLDAAVITMIQKAINEGDYYTLDGLFNRVVGKVTDKIEHKLPEPTVVEFRNGDKIVHGRAGEEAEDEENE